jgi:hypothetical protein
VDRQMDWEELQRRCGRFTVTREMLEDYHGAVLSLMRDVLVVRCEHEYWDSTFHYRALSPQFAVVEPGMEAPHYRLMFDRAGDGVVALSFVADGPPERAPLLTVEESFDRRREEVESVREDWAAIVVNDLNCPR